MNILTIDTSELSVVGVAREEHGDISVLATVSSTDARHHAETLTPMVRQALEEAEIDKPDIVVAGTGPAAFTGLRAGLMTARALTWGWGIELIGVSSAEVLALGGARQGANEVLAVIDARRKELFALRARPMGGDDVAVLSGPVIVRPEEIPAVLAAEPALLVAARPQLYPELAHACQISCTPDLMAALALSHVARREAGENCDTGTEPQYLRRPDIQGGVAQPRA